MNPQSPRLRKPGVLLALGMVAWVLFGVLGSFHFKPASAAATPVPAMAPAVATVTPATTATTAATPTTAAPAVAAVATPALVAQVVAVHVAQAAAYVALNIAPTTGVTAPSTPVPTLSAPSGPQGPSSPTGAAAPSTDASDTPVVIKVDSKPSQSITIMLLLTVASVAPSLVLLMTSFTKIFVVLSITRNALGLTNVPPNQVLAGLSLFVSMFIMGPVLVKVNNAGIQPYLNGTKTRTLAFRDGMAPLRTFMLAHTRPDEIALMLRSAGLPNPAHAADIGLTTLIPAFVLSELRSAMIIGFVVYIPFLIIDLVVSSSLMSLGMMMLPPVSVSLPFKMLLFVLVDGWGLVIQSLVASYKTG